MKKWECILIEEDPLGRLVYFTCQPWGQNAWEVLKSSYFNTPIWIPRKYQYLMREKPESIAFSSPTRSYQGLYQGNTMPW